MAKDDKRKPRPFDLRDLRDEWLKLFAETEWFKQNERLMMRALVDKGCRFLEHHGDVETRFELVLPEPASPPPQRQAETRSPKSLIEAEVTRRVAAGEHYDTITGLSRSLHEWMKTGSGKPLASRTIENRLRDWGLWPLPSKK